MFPVRTNRRPGHLPPPPDYQPVTPVRGARRVCHHPQAQLALPVLVLVQAITPPLLLAGPLQRKRLEPWRGLLHAANVALAVGLARFAIFDILAVSVTPTQLRGACRHVCTAAASRLCSTCGMRDTRQLCAWAICRC